MRKIDLNSNLTSRTIMVTISSIMINAIAMFTAPIFTRLLTASDYGVYSVFVSWTSIFAIVFSMQTYGSLNNAKVEFNKKQYAEYVADVYRFSILLFGIVSIIFFVFRNSMSNILKLPEECIVLLIISACGSFTMSFVTNYYTIEENVTRSLWISAFYTILSTVLAIWFIYERILTGYLGRIVGVVIPQIVVIVYTIIILKVFSRSENTQGNIDFCLKITLPLVAYGVSGILLGQVDRMMLLSMMSEATAGIYSFCYTIALPVTIINGALNSTWVPQYYIYMSEGKNDKIDMHQKRYLFLVVCITCGFLLVAPEVAKILSVKEYWEGIGIIPLVAVGYFFDFLCLFPSNYEFYLKKTNYLAVISCIGGGINIVINYFLIPRFGMFGAAFATIISHIIIFLMHEYVARYIVKGYGLKRRFYLRGILPVTSCLLLYYLIEDIWWLRWGVASIIGIVVLRKIIKQKALI